MHRPRLPHLLLTASLAFLPAASVSAADATPDTPIEQRLSAAQMQATGLDRLTPAQLSLLNRILREQRAMEDDADRTRRFGLRNVGPASTEAAEPEQIESVIAGEFRGWSPGTVLTLANGQVWRVLEGSLQTRRVDGPAATITRSGFGSRFLKVDGHNARAKVTRVR